MIFAPQKCEIQALPLRNRVMQHNLCDNMIAPLLESRPIYDNSACREGKGTHFAMERLAEFFRGYYKLYGAEGYILKCDIHRYFDSIDL